MLDSYLGHIEKAQDISNLMYALNLLKHIVSIIVTQNEPYSLWKRRWCEADGPENLPHLQRARGTLSLHTLPVKVTF
jgi:hypothetical protein